MSMTKADHHKAALCENIRTKTFPKGLCAFIELHIFEPDETVLAEWEIAHEDFRKALVSVLIRHYEKIVRHDVNQALNYKKLDSLISLLINQLISCSIK